MPDVPELESASSIECTGLSDCAAETEGLRSPARMLLVLDMKEVRGEVAAEGGARTGGDGDGRLDVDAKDALPSYRSSIEGEVRDPGEWAYTVGADPSWKLDEGSGDGFCRRGLTRLAYAP